MGTGPSGGADHAETGVTAGTRASSHSSCGPGRDEWDPNPGISMGGEGEAGGGKGEGVRAVGKGQPVS